MAKIYLVRHAESNANVDGKFQGQSYDTDLSDLGEDQAYALGEAFSRMYIEEVVSSPLGRAIQTAEAIAMETGVEVIEDERLSETDHGKWEGKNKSVIEKTDPELYKTWLTTPSKAEFPGGETFKETVRRVRDFMDDYIWTGRTVIVTHDNIARIMICLAKGMSVDDMWSLELEPAAINYLEVKEGLDGRYYQVIKLNETKHLKGLKSDVEKHAL